MIDPHTSVRSTTAALAHAPIGVALVDDRGAITWVNGAFVSMWSLADPAKVVGRPARWAWGERGAEIEHALASNARWSGDVQAAPPPSQARCVRLTVARLDEGDHTVLFVERSTQTEAFERAQVALRESERLGQAIRVSNIGIFDHDHLANTLYWSPGQYRLFGVDEERPVNLAFVLSRVFLEDQARIGMAVRRAHDPDGDGMFDVEHRIVRDDGAVRWTTTRSRTFFAEVDGIRRPVRTVGAMRDITADREAEIEREALHAQLVQAQKLESVARLAGGVAHDFNNLLTAVLAAADFLRDKVHDAEARQDVDHITAAAKRAAALTRQLLAFARRQPLARRRLDLNELLTELLGLIERTLGQQILFEVATCPDLPAVLADPGEIEQVVINLCVNARDAMPDGGTLRLETSVCGPPDGGADGNLTRRWVAIRVSDTGPGIAPDLEDQIFEPFFTTKPSGQGTGLGLAVSYGIVSQHGGVLRVARAATRGACFEIVLPSIDGAAQAIGNAAEASLVGGTETLLVVDDEELVRRVAERALAGAGYRVLVAADGSQALRVLQEHADSVDLVVIDAMMPVLGGREALARMREQDPGLRAILISGYMDDNGGETPDIGDTPFLPKPFAPAALLRLVRATLDEPTRTATRGRRAGRTAT